jgi:L-threonylcarbamoyladenylate synthase
LIVHVATKNLTDLVEQGVIANLPDGTRSIAQSLVDKFWPGPLTIVLPRGSAISDLITSGQPTVALRMPASDFFLQLIQHVGPLAAPSANTFSHVSPSSAAHVIADLGEVIPLVIDGGPCAVGLESTIVKVDQNGSVTALRLGGLELGEISTAISRPISVAEKSSDMTPGQLLRHYSPNIPTRIVQKLPDTIARNEDFAVIEPIYTTTGARLTQLYFPLCDDGLSQTAARNLFGILRQAEQVAAQELLIKLPTNNDGLWPAISDRLKRAAHRD